jgi:transcriptional regulator with GAF, ATPase, and Fis domain
LDVTNVGSEITTLTLKEQIDATKKLALATALKECNYSRTGAAIALAISRRTVLYGIKRFGFAKNSEVEKFLTAE